MKEERHKMELDNKKKVENIYLLGAMGQIILISGIIFVLRKLGYTMDYSTAVGMICIALGGCSTALWGIIVNVKYLNRSASKLVYDFFNIRKSYKWYPFILLLIGIDFSYLYFGSSLIIDQWYAPFFIFLKAIVFGGIEEIGWRYTFQPALEKKLGFIGATITTFLHGEYGTICFFTSMGPSVESISLILASG